MRVICSPLRNGRPAVPPVCTLYFRVPGYSFSYRIEPTPLTCANLPMTPVDKMLVPVDATTKLVALIGNPVAHSLSHFLHNSAFRAQTLDFAYVTLKVEQDDIPAAVAGLRALGFAGANVTAPHKRAVIPELDEISAQARAVGAVNTIVMKDSSDRVRLEGDNTDVAGFLAPLLEYADRLRGASATILGSGGAARAVAYAVLTTFRPDRLNLVARTPQKAERLAADLAGFDETSALRVVPLREAVAARQAVRDSPLVVNATPVGTHPNVGRTPWEYAGDFGDEHVVYDLVYNPQYTRLLREASDQGAATVDGLEMLIGQAAAAYALWTGREMPTDVVRDALQQISK